MKKILGALFIVAGSVLGLYIGGWHLFIGSILDIAKSIDNDTVTATLIAINLIKIFVAGVVGWGIFYIGFIIGGILMSFDRKKSFKRRK